MRELLCEACGTEKHKITGVRLIHSGRIAGEPNEYERVIWGRARVPQAKQRIRRIGDTITLLDPAHYDCDLCSAEIKPGARCMTWTVWVEGRAFHEGDEPAIWEDEFVERTP